MEKHGNWLPAEVIYPQATKKHLNNGHNNVLLFLISSEVVRQLDQKTVVGLLQLELFYSILSCECHARSDSDLLPPATDFKLIGKLLVNLH